MVYIRVKKINKYNYAYLVESFQTKNGSRQKVKKYLGRIYHFERKKEKQETYLNPSDKKSFVLNMIIPELLSLGFNKIKKELILKNLIFNTEKLTLKKRTKSETLKDAIISLNEGYICSFTLQRLLKFEKTDNLKKDATLLAKYFLEAGIKISQQDFITYYQLL